MGWEGVGVGGGEGMVVGSGGLEWRGRVEKRGRRGFEVEGVGREE